MKKLKIIYNPFSGDKMFKNNLDIYIEKFQNAGFDVSIFRSNSYGDIDRYLSNIKSDEFDTFVISGGDGSINLVVNSIMKYGLNSVNLGVIPSGTANDLATFLKIPKEYEKNADVVCNGSLKSIDVGLVNDKYFINVCAGGLFANVSEIIDKDFKETFGKLAYYIKGIEQMTTHEPLKLRITNSSKVIEERFNLFLVLNSSGTGGIEKISPNASISDGKFDFVGFKNVELKKMPQLAIKFLKGDYLDADEIVFFTDNQIKIEFLEGKSNSVDLDGETGPSYPIEIRNISKVIKIRVPKK